MISSIGRALVIGGGFSGSSAAITLSRAGVAVHIVEINPRWTTDAAGISIGGASIRSLAALGVLDRFLADGYANDDTDIRTPTGELVARLPSPRLAGTDVPGNGAIMRPLLGQALADAALAAGATIRLATTVTDLADDGDGVDVAFSDGSTDRYDLVIGADGLYSKLRQRLLPGAPAPKFSGQGAWRAVVPRPADIVRTTVWTGARVKVGVNPISQAQMYLFVNENLAAREHVADADLVPRLRALIEPFPDPRVQAIRASICDDSLVLFRPMDNLLVPLPWHRGRVVLIGDAVHATTPHLAAGAGIGIEDALVLAAELEAGPTLEDGLAAFELRRWDRCRMVVENSARLGVLEGMPDGHHEHTALMQASFRALAQPI